MINEKELLKQLNNLKEVKLAKQWKDNNRNLLLRQISGGQEIGASKLYDKLKDLWQTNKIVAEQLAQPIGMVILIMAVFLGAGIAGLQASRDTKPGDSLYIAKIISEKTQQVLTFDDKEKAKLSLEFAGNRAKELTRLLAESEKNKNQDIKVEKLSRNFKKELDAVRSRLGKINIAAGKTAAENQTVNNQDQTAADNTSIDTGEELFSANLDKSDLRLEISEFSRDDEQGQTSDQPLTDSDLVENKEDDSAAVSTSTDEKNQGDNDNANKILEEAEKLFDERDYSGTINKLEEINAMINKSEPDQNDSAGVKGDSDQAASASTTTADDSVSIHQSMTESTTPIILE